MLLHQVVGWPGPMTHRQFRTWQEWLRREWNNPSRSDYYVMQGTAEYVRSVAANPSGVKLEGFKIPFRDEQKKLKLTDAEIHQAIAVSIDRAGKKPRVRLPDGTLVPMSEYKGPL